MLFPGDMEPLSVTAAFPDVEDAELARLAGRLDNLETLAYRWCSREWGRSGGVSYESFFTEMKGLFSELSPDAIGLVLDWGMFANR